MMHVRKLLALARQALGQTASPLVRSEEAPQDTLQLVGTALLALDEQADAPLEMGDERAHVICLCPDCTKPRATLNKDRNVVIGSERFIADFTGCPRGAKVLLLGPGDVATLGIYDGDPQWRGWYPIPRRPL